MASDTTTTSRRALLGALAIAPAAVGSMALLPAPAEAAKPDRDTFDDGFEAGRVLGIELTLDHMARAWIDRFKACGGCFGLQWKPDGSIDCVIRSVPMPYIWKPTDEGNSKLKPHIWLTEQDHQPGALKVLDAMLVMVPGLEDAIYEIAGVEVFARHGREVA